MIGITSFYRPGFSGKIWMCSDFHFGHKVVLQDRIFQNTDVMDNILIRNANRVVGKDDILIIVGDITMAGGNKSRYAESMVNKLPGKKVLVLGNHDKFKPRWYLKRGFFLVATSLVLDGGILVVHDPSEAENWPVDKPVVCGHVHTLFKVKQNVVNVGVDVWDYTPVLLDDALSLCAGMRDRGVEWSKNRHGVKHNES